MPNIAMNKTPKSTMAPIVIGSKSRAIAKTVLSMVRKKGKRIMGINGYITIPQLKLFVKPI